MSSSARFDSVLVANRGEIAARVLRTVKSLGLRTLLVAHRIDVNAPALALADDVRFIDGPTPVAAFLDGAQIIAAAKAMGAGAIHPGYGFLSENAGFARAVTEAGLIFIGPRAETIDLMGDKIRARNFVAERGFPVAPSATEDSDPATFAARARGVGAPLLIKPAAGGGGKGMRIVRDLSLLDEEIIRARSEGQRYFGDGRLFVERYIENPRHIEVQVLGDEHGKILHLFERECSLQRRFQKIVEEAPAPTLTATERAEICNAAAGIAAAARYQSAGTVEFIYGAGKFYFLEMNTRLQVEHPVTEAITGLDLVAEQIRIAQGEALTTAQQDIKTQGHAIELRICAEDSERDFAPMTGPILRLRAPVNARFDNGVAEGGAVTSAFDPMIGKLIVHAADRPAALQAARDAVEQLVIFGVKTNAAYLGRLLGDPDVQSGALQTGLIAEKTAILPDEQPNDAAIDLITAAAALTVPDIRHEADLVPRLHAAIGAWRN